MSVNLTSLCLVYVVNVHLFAISRYTGGTGKKKIKIRKPFLGFVMVKSTHFHSGANQSFHSSRLLPCLWNMGGNLRAPRKPTQTHSTQTREWTQVYLVRLDLFTVKALSHFSITGKGWNVMCYESYIKPLSTSTFVCIVMTETFALGGTSCCADGPTEALLTQLGPIELWMAS